MVARYANGIQCLHALYHFSWIGSVTDQIPCTYDYRSPLAINITQNALQRMEVAMYVLE